MSQDRAVNDRTEVVLHSVMTILSGSAVFVFQDKNHDFETDLTVAWPFSAMRLAHVAVVSKTPEGSRAALPISCTFSHSMDQRASMSRELRPLGSPYLGASNLHRVLYRSFSQRATALSLAYGPTNSLLLCTL